MTERNGNTAPASAAPPRIKHEAPIPRLALTCPGETAAALGVSVEYFNAHVRPDLRLVRRGRLVLADVRELQSWLDRASALTLER